MKIDAGAIFPELKKHLGKWFDEAPETKYVITSYRDTNANLRTQFERILTNASVKPWQRLFHNLRASRETELMNHFPAHFVCEWIGNGENVATKHYLQVTEGHFAHATAEGGQTVGPESS